MYIPIKLKTKIETRNMRQVASYFHRQFMHSVFAQLMQFMRISTCEIHPQIYVKLKEQYPVTAHAPNFDFRTGCREIKRCEESKRTLKNPFASGLVELNTTLKLLRITDHWYIVPVMFQFGRNEDFLALLLLPLAGRLKDGKHFDADWRLISSANFHTSSDNCEMNTQKWNSNN